MRTVTKWLGIQKPKQASVSHLMPSPDGFHIFIFVICILLTVQLFLYVPDIHLECIFIKTELQLRGVRYK